MIIAAGIWLGNLSAALAGANPANDRLAALSLGQQVYALGRAVGEGCEGRDAFYMGMEKASAKAFWSVRCRDGREFAVMIDPDSGGSTTILECPILELMGKVHCFRRFVGQ
jgi:hypothetical protein